MIFLLHVVKTTAIFFIFIFLPTARAQVGSIDFEKIIKTANYEKAIVVGLVYSKAYIEELDKKGVDRLTRYRSAMKRAGAEILEISQNDSPQLLAKKMARVDGLLLPGGIDVDSKFYTKDAKFIDKFQASDIDFDIFEFALIKYARQKKLPLFGICRGAQLINVAMGGTLYQDLETFNQFLKQPHLKRSVAGVAAAEEHLLHLVRNSRFASVLGVAEIRANSWHHQAVNRIASGLRVVALSPDKVIEGFESVSDWYVTGIQSHPEIALADDGKSKFLNVFTDFKNEAKQFHAANLPSLRLRPDNLKKVSGLICNESTALRLKIK